MPLQLPLHRGPIGSALCLLLRGDRARAGLRDPVLAPPGGVRKSDRPPRLAHARAHRLLLGARPPPLRLVGGFRRCWGRPHLESDPAREPRPRRAGGSGFGPPRGPPSPEAPPPWRGPNRGAAACPRPPA